MDKKQDLDLNMYRRYARITGILYLIIIVCAGFSQGAVRELLVVWGDSATTASNISENLTFFKAGIITDLIAFMCDIGVSVLLYYLLAPVGKVLSMLAAAFRLIAHPAIGSLNLLNQYAAARVIENPTIADTVSNVAMQDASLFFMELHYVGYLIAGALFGIHCLLLGILLYRSSFFPSVLGVLLAFSAVGYLIESFGYILVPEFKSTFALIVGITAVLGEVSLTIWLLAKGVKATPT
jgi:hypothetical protein